MTEAEWQAANDGLRMIGLVRPTASERKRRLFSCACCRRVWNELTDERSTRAVLMAEEYADGLIDDNLLELAANPACEAWDATGSRDGLENDRPLPLSAAAYNVALPMGWWGGAPAFQPPESIVLEAAADQVHEGRAQCDLLRDIFGNPFRPVAFDPSWRTSTVVAIAKGMYDSRDFAPMPLLADALQDAGCEHADILDHCRGPGPHVNGCWVVDLVLGKE
jgi:hypothetical protein